MQEAWIQHATVKENILFGQPFDSEKYNAVVFACALEKVRGRGPEIPRMMGGEGHPAPPPDVNNICQLDIDIGVKTAVTRRLGGRSNLCRPLTSNNVYPQ